MGLDMYLCKKVSYWETEEIKVKGRSFLESMAKKECTERDLRKGIAGNGIVEIRLNAMYWRKANMIHGWFVKNYAEEDDCKPIELEISDLKKLLKVCEECVWNDEKAAKMLPPQMGYFFGSLDIDREYHETLEQTIKELRNLIKTHKEGDEYEYQASW